MSADTGPDRAGLALTGLLVPPLAWALQLSLLYLLGDLRCRGGADGTFLGLDVGMLWLLVSAVAAVVALAGLALSLRLWRRPRPRAGGPEGSPADGTVGFLGRLGALSGGLFLATILLGATAPAFLSC